MNQVKRLQSKILSVTALESQLEKWRSEKDKLKYFSKEPGKGD